MTRITIFRHFLTFLQISFIFAITVLTYNHFMMSHESPHRATHFSKNLDINKSQCNSWESHKKWKSLNFTIKKTTKLFLSLEDFFWKQPMSQLHLPYGPRGSELMILKVLAATASYEMPAHIENLECKTCVVVGNSFAIKNTSLGNLINKYDVVMWLNDAPVRGYEQDVGNKTTMRIFYPESATSNPALNNEEDTLMVLVPFKPNDLRWLKEILYDEKRDRRGFWRPPPLTWEVNSSNVRVLDPFFMYETGNQLVKNQKSFRPTTGFLAVFVALNYCDVVHLAGFGYPSKSNPQQLIHYFGRNTMNHMKSSPHDIDREGKVLKKLEDLGA
uniref:CMP-N-acetylneuraminate-beta-galactosamide-alpha-2,3-sialyltransferase 4 n=1 Tax=Oryzias melastigma TaxID=30732 RepID=A0A3B3BGE5_ORYME